MRRRIQKMEQEIERLREEARRTEEELREFERNDQNQQKWNRFNPKFRKKVLLILLVCNLRSISTKFSYLLWCQILHIRLNKINYFCFLAWNQLCWNTSPRYLFRFYDNFHFSIRASFSKKRALQKALKHVDRKSGKKSKKILPLWFSVKMVSRKISMTENFSISTLCFGLIKWTFQHPC